MEGVRLLLLPEQDVGGLSLWNVEKEFPVMLKATVYVGYVRPAILGVGEVCCMRRNLQGTLRGEIC